MLHPLLRDLLARRLREVPVNDPFSHVGVHRLLKDRYDSLGQREDALYTHSCSAMSISSRTACARMSTNAATAGSRSSPPSRRPRCRREKARITARRSHARGGNACAPPALAAPCTAASTGWCARRPGCWRTRSSRCGNCGPAAVSPARPWRCTSTIGPHRYPRRWPGRNALRRTAVYLVAVLLVLYGAAFYLQNERNCLRYGIYEPAELVADLMATSPVCPNQTERNVWA